jgi:hypothetical protein
MLKMLRVVMAAWIVALALPARGQLAAGDIAFVAYSTDGADEFSWVALRRIPAHTTINFTDMSVSNGGFRLSEHLSPTYHGPLSWWCTNAVEAGSVVWWMGGTPGAWSLGQGTGGGPTLSSEGDQLIAYCGVIVTNTALPAPWQGDACGATLLHALNFANSGWDNVTGGSTERSFVPPGLSTNTFTAVHVSSKDNGYYSGPTVGSKDELLRAIANPANWTVSDIEFETIFWTGAEAFRVKPRGMVMSIK